MARDRKKSPLHTNGNEEEDRVSEEQEEEQIDEAPSKRDHRRKSKRSKNESSESEEKHDYSSERKKRRKKKKVSKRSSRRRYSDEDEGSYSSSSYSSDSGSESDSDRSDYTSEESESEDERDRRKRKERERKKRRRKEREYEKEKRRSRREKEKKRRKRDKEEKDGKKKKKKEKKKKEVKMGAVTNSWGTYGIIRETDMWNKRPEFTAWLAELKQVNLEALSNWEEKQMFKEFMEDHNTATFPSKKYYDLDAYHKRKMEKEIKRGFKRVSESERTIFNDEEQRLQELQLAREKHKEEQVEELKRSMQSGLAQAMKEQAQLREEMAYQYKLGNFEAAAAIQKRLDPDVAM